MRASHSETPPPAGRARRALLGFGAAAVLVVLTAVGAVRLLGRAETAFTVDGGPATTVVGGVQVTVRTTSDPIEVGGEVAAEVTVVNQNDHSVFMEAPCVSGLAVQVRSSPERFGVDDPAAAALFSQMGGRSSSIPLAVPDGIGRCPMLPPIIELQPGERHTSSGSASLASFARGSSLLVVGGARVRPARAAPHITIAARLTLTASPGADPVDDPDLVKEQRAVAAALREPAVVEWLSTQRPEQIDDRLAWQDDGPRLRVLLRIEPDDASGAPGAVLRWIVVDAELSEVVNVAAQR